MTFAYRDHRVEITPVQVGDRWNAQVKIRSSVENREPPLFEILSQTLTAELAEKRAEIWAKRWVDLKFEGGLLES